MGRADAALDFTNSARCMRSVQLVLVLLARVLRAASACSKEHAVSTFFPSLAVMHVRRITVFTSPPFSLVHKRVLLLTRLRALLWQTRYSCHVWCLRCGLF